MNRQLFQYNPIIGYTFVPGLKTRVAHEGGGYLIQVNEAGFRSNREFESSKEPGRFRVLLFGNSFTAADGVSNKHRYGDLLEASLPDLEVFNFGLPGTGTDQHYLIYHEMAARREHDLVLIAVAVENVRRVVARYRIYQTPDGQRRIYAKPYFTLQSDGTLQRHHIPVAKDPIVEGELPPQERQYVDRGGRLSWLRQTVNKLGRRVKDLAQRTSHYQPLPAYDSPANPDWLLMKAILARWILEARKPVVVCPIPLYQHVEETSSPAAYQARFQELGQATGARIHDPLPDYWKTPRAERQKFRFAKDIHPTPASHRVLAESLAPCIRAHMEGRSG